MNVLLIEPLYRKRSRAMVRGDKNIPDDSLWYPPIGLMKIARYHRQRKDNVVFISGVPNYKEKFSNEVQWDIIYITTLFTFHYKKVIETIDFFKSRSPRVVVGGILATLMSEDILMDTGVSAMPGLLKSARQLGFEDDTNIDTLTPDYSILSKQRYAINDTFYSYTTRGCSNKCPWCAVPKLEPLYEDYKDIKYQIEELRVEYGDYSRLKLMDNNVLVSNSLEKIIDDLVKLGYGRGKKTSSGKLRTVDFNQGVDASHINESTIKLLAKVNISPLRIAFDRYSEKDIYTDAVELAFKNNFNAISNYMLYNFKDSPKDLYERIWVNIDLNKKWKDGYKGNRGQVYCYPMRYAPINQELGEHANQERNYFNKIENIDNVDWLNAPQWTPRFSRSIDVIKGVAHGSIPITPSLARRAIGRTFHEFVTNLYMPENMLRYRDKYEKTLYKGEKKRKAGNGDIEKFREFILSLIAKNNNHFHFFHNAVVPNKKAVIREAITKSKNTEIIYWLERYLE